MVNHRIHERDGHPQLPCASGGLLVDTPRPTQPRRDGKKLGVTGGKVAFVVPFLFGILTLHRLPLVVRGDIGVVALLQQPTCGFAGDGSTHVGKVGGSHQLIGVDAQRPISLSSGIEPRVASRRKIITPAEVDHLCATCAGEGHGVIRRPGVDQQRPVVERPVMIEQGLDPGRLILDDGNEG